MVKISLLEYLQLQCSCEYLSDLKYCMHFPEKLRTMKNPEQFSVEEWNRALEYLTEKPFNCQSLREVNEYLAGNADTMRDFSKEKKEKAEMESAWQFVRKTAGK